MVRKLSEKIIQHRFMILGASLLITIFFLFEISKVKVYTKFRDLLPLNHPYIKTHLQYEKQLGEPLQVFLALTVKNGDIYNPVTLEKIKRITDELDAIPGVNHDQVYSIASRKIKKVIVFSGGISSETLMQKVPRTEKEIKQFKEDAKATGGVYGVYINPNENATFFSANFIESLLDYTTVFNQVNKIIARETDLNHKLYAAGEPMLTGWVYHYQKQMYEIFVVTGLTMLGLLLFYFRNLPGVIVPVTCAVLNAIWGLGVVSILGYNIEPLTMVVPLLIVARALSHSVQITERYFECYHELKDVQKACVESTASILPPGTLGIFADVFGILLIAIAPIPIIQKLAYMCAFWALSILVTGLVLTPILLSFFKPPANIPDIVDIKKGAAEKILRIIGRVSAGSKVSAYAVIGVAILLAIWTGAEALNVDIGDVNPGTPILWPKSVYNRSVAEINNNFPGTDELYVIIQGTHPDTIKQPEVLRTIRRFQEYMGRTEEVTRTLALTDFLPPFNRYLNLGYPKWEVLPDNYPLVGQLVYFLLGRSSPGDFDRYFKADFSNANVVLWYKNHTGDTLRRTMEHIKDFIANQGNKVKDISFRLASGNMGVLAAVNETVAETQLLNFIFVTVVIFIICAYTYHSFLAALILLIPINLANLVTLAVMYNMRISLNIDTLPVVSVGVGVGIDYGIYLLSRICEQYRENPDYKTSIVQSILTTGKAIFFTSTTMTAGVIFWYFLSSIRFQAEMGLLLAFILFMNMLGALLLIPAIIFIFKPAFIAKVKLVLK